MLWTVHGERTVYDSPWVRMVLADVEIPGHRRFEHHVIRVPNPAAGAVIHDPDRGVLLIWRHRFITDTWAYEIPSGRAEPGERLIDTAAREALEETGWRVGPLTPLVRYHPSNGLSNQTFGLFAAAGASYVGPPSDPTEAERIEWVPVDDVRAAVAAGEVTDGLSLTALLYALCFGPLR